MQNYNLKLKITKTFNFQRGQSLVEILLALGLAAVLLPSLLTGFVSSREGKVQQNQRAVAQPLLVEAQEAVRSVREKGWTAFSVNGTYHPVISGSAWALASGTEMINGLTRSVVINTVNRDTTGAIVTSGGTPDFSTKKVTISVSWTAPYASSISSTTYLTRHQNDRYEETTQAEFDLGTPSGVSTANVSGGEVQLGASGRGNWCEPNLNINAFDLPKSGVANAISVIEGSVFAGTGDNSSGVSYATVSLSNPPYPANPVGTLAGTFDGYKTNGVFGETGYAYIATDNNGKEIVIINLSASPYSQAGYFNAPGNGSGDSVFVSGTVGYMTDGNKLYTFDLTSKSGSRSVKGNVTLAGTGNKVVVVGNYAYVAINSTSNQLEIIDVSNPDAPISIKRFSLAGQAAKDIFVNSTGDRAYLATANSAGQREMFIVDISNKTSPVVKGSFEADGMSPKGITVTTGNKLILVGTGAEEYQVVNIVSETAPTQCGGLNIDSGVNGVGSVLEADGDAYSYIITGDASTELKIIAGGSGSQYSAGGTFISRVFEATASAAFNSFSATVAVPSATTLKLQVGVADPSPDCAGATYTFVGPDKSLGTYFTSLNSTTITGVIPTDDDGVGYENPAKCFKYKAYLDTTDSTQTPVFYDISFNYSP